MQGYRGAMAILPERDLGVVILWNSGSSLPSGLMPTILDRAIGLSSDRWLAIDYDYDPDVETELDADTRYGSEDPQGRGGASTQVSHAQPY